MQNGVSNWWWHRNKLSSFRPSHKCLPNGRINKLKCFLDAEDFFATAAETYKRPRQAFISLEILVWFAIPSPYSVDSGSLGKHWPLSWVLEIVKTLDLKYYRPSSPRDNCSCFSDSQGELSHSNHFQAFLPLACSRENSARLRCVWSSPGTPPQVDSVPSSQRALQCIAERRDGAMVKRRGFGVKGTYIVFFFFGCVKSQSRYSDKVSGTWTWERPRCTIMLPIRCR